MPRVSPPRGLHWRSHTVFIVATVALGLFTDLFLYGLVVPVMPFVLRDRLLVPDDEVQPYVSRLLAVYAGVQLLVSVPIGWLADRTKSRQLPFLSGLAALFAGTVMLAVGRNMAVLVAARALQGMSAAVVWTVGLAMVLDTVGTNNLGKTMGTIFSTISIGQLVAPVVGGVLYNKTGYGGIFGLATGVIGLDFIMRLLLVEKKSAAKYGGLLVSDGTSSPDGTTREDEETEAAIPTESDALVPAAEDGLYEIRDETSKPERSFPILYCLRNPRLPAAFFLSFLQAALLGLFDATVPTEAQSLFGFNSQESGLLFIPLDITYLLLGPVAGWAVDRFGTKPVAVLGFGYLVPVLILLRLPAEELVRRPSNVILYCALLALCGVGLAIIGPPSFVEASEVVRRYDKANPGFFGANGPYAQLYGFSSLFFCAGLTIGPLAGGVLRDKIGYGNMNAIFAALSGVAVVLSFFIVGGRSRLARLHREA